jgi:hypothetical protein
MALVIDACVDEALPTTGYDAKTMNPRQVKRFDPAARAAAKQSARDADARALARGEFSAAELHRRNGLLAFHREHLDVDFAGFISSPR